MEKKYNIKYHIADVIYQMYSEISMLKHLIVLNPESNMVDIWNKQISTIIKYRDRLEKTEEYKDWVEEAQKIPSADEIIDDLVGETSSDEDLVEMINTKDKCDKYPNTYSSKNNKDKLCTTPLNDNIENDSCYYYTPPKKDNNGWISIPDYIADIIEKAVEKSISKVMDKYMPDWYKERYYRPIWVDPHYDDNYYEKIPYWLRPDYNKQPTCWKEDTDMFKVHPENEPIYSDKCYYSTGTKPNTNTTITC